MSLPLHCSSAASDNSQRFQETCFAFALTPQQVQQISSSMWDEHRSFDAGYWISLEKFINWLAFYRCVVIIFSCDQRDISGTKCDFSVQVQLRFCLSETSCPQEDHFPPNLCVKVNGKPCNLPVRSSAFNGILFPQLTDFSFDEYSNLTSVYSQQNGYFSLFASNILICHPGLSSSNQKRRRAQAAQSAHQHYLTGQIVHHSPQHHCGVVDCWDWKGKDQSVIVCRIKLLNLFCASKLDIFVFWCYEDKINKF